MQIEQLLLNSKPGLIELLQRGQWHVQHGKMDRFPEFMQADDGALSNINKLAHWQSFVVGSWNKSGDYVQTEPSRPASEHYDRGDLVRFSGIEQASEEARTWLDALAGELGLAPEDLRLTAWAARGATGISWHFDPEDVIHFQIKGSKRFGLHSSEASTFADTRLYKHYSSLLAKEDFSEAVESVVREGTLTIIPRGVWHCSLGQSEESFAIAVCISPPTCARAVSDALFERLRLLGWHKQTMLGPVGGQSDAMEACIRDACGLLTSMEQENILTEKFRLAFPINDIESLTFRVTPGSHIDLESGRVWVQDNAYQVAGDNSCDKVLQAIWQKGPEFTVQMLRKNVPEADHEDVCKLLAMLTKIRFLRFVYGIIKGKDPE
jgi:ribosomal protein L16 Arg81 hydroxylase